MPLADRFRHTLRALRHRNYRLFFAGQLVSLVGTWMTSVAMSWLVWRLTHSAFLLGAVAFASYVPAFLLGPIAGVLVDRFDKRRVVIGTQVLAMVQSLLLAVLTLGGVITVTEVLLLALFQGAINGFDIPARQSFLVEMIEDRADLPNAIALNSSMFNAARLIGPSIGGLVIAAVGEGWCFAVDTVSYVGVIASLLAMRVAPRPRREGPPKQAAAELADGFRYVTRTPAIRALLLLVASVSLLGLPYTALLPIFAARVLHGGPQTLGYLMGASGVGALLGAVTLAARRSVLGLGALLPRMVATFAAGIATFALSRSLALSMGALVVAGFGFMVQMASSNTLLQTIVDDDKRGRVMSFFLMAYFGTAPFGSLMAGWVSDRYGAPVTVAFGGACAVAGAIWFATTLSSIEHQLAPAYARVDR
jgi:MFS family permease